MKKAAVARGQGGSMHMKVQENRLVGPLPIDAAAPFGADLDADQGAQARRAGYAAEPLITVMGQEKHECADSRRGRRFVNSEKTEAACEAST